MALPANKFFNSETMKMIQVQAFGGEEAKPLRASATPHGRLLGIPGSFHQAQNHTNQERRVLRTIQNVVVGPNMHDPISNKWFFKFVLMFLNFNFLFFQVL